MDEIVRRKRPDLERQKALRPQRELEKRAAHLGPARNFASALSKPGQVALIAELKKASPSAGELRNPYEVPPLARAYERAGAAALSVLTEENFFRGSLDHIAQAKGVVKLPVLRKDFIVDPYQIYESRVYGADAVLLIVALLEDWQIKSFLQISQGLGLAALVEAHDDVEVRRALECGAHIVGVNSRNLNDLTMNPDAFQRLVPLIPKDRVIVAESGIKTMDDVKALRALGVNAMLVGESLLRQRNLEEAARTLIKAGEES